MYLKKIPTGNRIIAYHCKSKSQAKRWLRSQGLTKQGVDACENSFSFVEPGNCENYARLFWQESILRASCWVLHHLPPGV